MGRDTANTNRSFISHHGDETFFSSGHQQGPGDFWFLAQEAKVSFNLEVNPPRAEIPSLRVDESLFLCTHTAGRTKPAILRSSSHQLPSPHHSTAKHLWDFTVQGRLVCVPKPPQGWWISGSCTQENQRNKHRLEQAHKTPSCRQARALENSLRASEVSVSLFPYSPPL